MIVRNRKQRNYRGEIEDITEIIMVIRQYRNASEVHDVYEAFSKITIGNSGYTYDPTMRIISMHFTKRTDVSQLINRLMWLDEGSD